MSADPSPTNPLTPKTTVTADFGRKAVLLDRERQFSLLVSAVREYALYMLDPYGRIASWNAGAANIKGYKEDEVIGENFSIFYPRADQMDGIPMRNLYKAAHEGRYEAEAQRIRKDGTVFWANVVIEPIFDGGKLIGFVKITRDITTRKEAEERLKGEMAVRCLAERAASDARQRLLDAIECIQDGFALFDADDRLLLANKRYLELHPSLQDEIVTGKSFEDLIRAGLYDPEARRSVPSENEISEHLTRHRIADGTPIIRRHGSKWLMSTEKHTSEGGIVVAETDITEIKRSELAKDEFLAMVSHELRTPLTPIYGALRLIGTERVQNDPQQSKELITAARRNCERLMMIVNDLLDITGINSGKSMLETSLVDLVPALEEIVANKRLDGVANPIVLDVPETETPIWIRGDRRRIQQVFDNILSNAIKFSDATINVRVSLEGKSVRVSIADQGCGIPTAFHARVFDPFTQSDSSVTRSKGGMGLGLALSKAIVEAHDGKIGFVSQEDEGTTFYIDLPAAELP